MIDANAVNKALLDCFFSDEWIKEHVKVDGTEIIFDAEAKARGVEIDGPLHKLFLDKEKLESHREEVVDWLDQLSDEFKATGGGGSSLLRAPFDKDGNQWGEQRNAAELFMLGMGLGLVVCLFPRKFWAALPGGLPYYGIVP